MKQELELENKELAAQLWEAGDNNSQVPLLTSYLAPYILHHFLHLTLLLTTNITSYMLHRAIHQGSLFTFDLVLAALVHLELL